MTTAGSFERRLRGLLPPIVLRGGREHDVRSIGQHNGGYIRPPRCRSNGGTSDRIIALTRISHAEEARLIGGRGEELASWRCSGLEGKRHSMDEGVWRNAPRSC